MRYNEIKRSIIANFAVSNLLVPFVEGKPGGGKSALARDIVRSMGIRPERITEFNPSLRDPVDIMGVPNTDGEFTQWKPPVEFWRLRDDGTDEPCALIVEELTDASVQMQNPLCRVILDRYAGELKLHPKLFIIATGNSTEHKSGANRMTTKLGNRIQHFKFDENLDDWVDWALRSKADGGGEIKQSIISFLRWRPELLSKFDSDKALNATPRTWEMGNAVSDKLPEDLYLINISGCVGEGPATEYVGFKAIADALPDPDAAVADPDNAKLPDVSRPDVQFAFAGALAERANKKTLGNIVKLCNRLPPELGTMILSDVAKRDRSLLGERAFIDWVKEGHKMFT